MEPQILIAEDEEGFRFIEKMAIEKSKLEKSFDFCINGKEVTLYLKELIEKQKKLPEIIVLDLNMPFMNGWEVFEWMSEQELLKGIRVIILSSSDNADDVEKAKTLALEYQVKPVGFDEYKEFFDNLA